MTNLPLSRQSDVVVQELVTETLIYDLKSDKAYCLNETSTLIWQMCDGSRTVAEISRSLSKKLNQPISEDVVWLALNDFKRDNLLEQSKQFKISFNGLNRRQVIKKIGFASMVALPLISSIVAPGAANAASGPANLSLFAACSSGTQCASGNCNNVSAFGDPPFSRQCCNNSTGFISHNGIAPCQPSVAACNAVCCSGSSVPIGTGGACGALFNCFCN